MQLIQAVLLFFPCFSLWITFYIFYQVPEKIREGRIPAHFFRKHCLILHTLFKMSCHTALISNLLHCVIKDGVHIFLVKDIIKNTCQWQTLRYGPDNRIEANGLIRWSDYFTGCLFQCVWKYLLIYSNIALNTTLPKKYRKINSIRIFLFKNPLY